MRLNSLLPGLVAVFASLLAGCEHEPTHRDWEAMGSNFAATLHGPSTGELDAEAALDTILAESRRWGSLFSDYEATSAVSALRGRKGDTLVVPPELHAILSETLRIGALSGGLFDLGLHDIKALWILQDAMPRVPPQDSVALALSRRWREGLPESGTFTPALHPLPDGRVALLTDSLPIDLGGIAKGYAVDRLSERLATLGWPVHLIQAGGEIRCAGKRERPWTLGIKNPRRTDTLVATIRLDSGAALSTSGDYERFFLDGGHRYHHILDPFTGEPSRSATTSATVLCGTSMQCDALSTTFFLLGPAKGIPLAAREGVQALWLSETPTGPCGIATPGWGSRLERRTLPECPGLW